MILCLGHIVVLSGLILLIFLKDFLFLYFFCVFFSSFFDFTKFLDLLDIISFRDIATDIDIFPLYIFIPFLQLYLMDILIAGIHNIILLFLLGWTFI